jgi:hypothetical protein
VSIGKCLGESPDASMCAPNEIVLHDRQKVRSNAGHSGAFRAVAARLLGKQLGKQAGKAPALPKLQLSKDRGSARPRLAAPRSKPTPAAAGRSSRPGVVAPTSTLLRMSGQVAPRKRRVVLKLLGETPNFRDQ